MIKIKQRQQKPESNLIVENSNFDHHHEYPIVYVGQTIDGLTVLKDIPNLSSISSSFNSDEYIVKKGIRKVPISEFNAKPTALFYASNDIDHTYRLADQIKASGQIKPLIVVHDKEGLYVLEGAHRLGALYLVGVKYIPALIVDDLSSLEESTRIISPDEKTIIDNKWVRPGDYLSHYKFGIGQILAIDLKSFSVPMVTFLPNNETDEKNAVYRSAHEFKQLSGSELRSLYNNIKVKENSEYSPTIPIEKLIHELEKIHVKVEKNPKAKIVKDLSGSQIVSKAYIIIGNKWSSSISTSINNLISKSNFDITLETAISNQKGLPANPAGGFGMHHQ